MMQRNRRAICRDPVSVPCLGYYALRLPEFLGSEQKRLLMGSACETLPQNFSRNLRACCRNIRWCTGLGRRRTRRRWLVVAELRCFVDPGSEDSRHDVFGLFVDLPRNLGDPALNGAEIVRKLYFGQLYFSRFNR
jgi:hypothetical protein